MKSNSLIQQSRSMLMFAIALIFLYSFVNFANASNLWSFSKWKMKASTVTMYTAQSYLCQDRRNGGNCSLLSATGGSSRDTLLMYNSSEKSVYMYVANKEGFRNQDRTGVFKEHLILKTKKKSLAYKLRNVYKL